MNNGSFLTSWSFDPYIAILAAVATYSFFLGKQRLVKADEKSLIPGQSKQSLFLIGIVILVFATMSPINHFSHIYLWDRVLQTLLIIAYAPAMIVMSAPWLYLKTGLASIFRRSDAVVEGSPRNTNPIWRFLTVPLVSFLIYNVTMVIWLVPSSISFAERYAIANEAMHISQLFAGLLLWLHLVDTPPFQPRVSPLIKRVVPTYFTGVISWVFAMVLGFANAPFYHVYINAKNTLSPMGDQEIASAILFIIVAGPFAYAGVNNTRRWMASENEYRRKPELDVSADNSGESAARGSKKKRKIPGLT